MPDYSKNSIINLNDKGNEKEEYPSPLEREDTQGWKVSEGRAGEGSFGTGRLKDSKLSRFVPVTGQGLWIGALEAQSENLIRQF